MIAVCILWLINNRVELDTESSYYIINGVVPPDESALKVNNSVYTNTIAALALQTAIEVNDILGKSSPPEWKEIADNMLIPFDSELGIHPEYEGYNGQLINQVVPCNPIQSLLDNYILILSSYYYSTSILFYSIRILLARCSSFAISTHVSNSPRNRPQRCKILSSKDQFKEFFHGI